MFNVKIFFSFSSTSFHLRKIVLLIPTKKVGDVSTNVKMSMENWFYIKLFHSLLKDLEETRASLSQMEQQLGHLEKIKVFVFTVVGINRSNWILSFIFYFLLILYYLRNGV